MVEPVSVGVVVAALIAKALNRAEDGVIEGGVGAARKAVEALRRRFSGDVEAEQALDGVVETPDSKKREKALAELLEARAGESAELIQELKAIAEQIEGAGVPVGDIEQVAEGENIAQIASSPSSQISISQGNSAKSRD